MTMCMAENLVCVEILLQGEAGAEGVILIFYFECSFQGIRLPVDIYNF